MSPVKYMAKLLVELNTKFVTDRPTIYEDFMSVEIEPKRFLEQHSKMDPGKIGLSITATNEGHEVGFLFYPKTKGKNSTLEIGPRQDGRGFQVSATGEFTSPTLKAGVLKYLEPVMGELDLRIMAVIYDGGMHSGANGLTSWVEGGDYEETSEGWRQTFPSPLNWKIL